MKPADKIKSIFGKEEISLKDLWDIFWSYRKIVVRWCIVFFVLGLIAALTSPKEYKAQCVLLTEQNAAASGSSLQGLAGLAGINMQNPAGADNSISSDLYPIVLSSQPFLLDLANDTIVIPDGRSITLKEYFRKGEKTNWVVKTKNFVLGIPGMTTGLFSGSGGGSGAVGSKLPGLDTMRKAFPSTASVIALNGDERNIVGVLKNRIDLKQKDQQATLSVKMPEPLLCAEVTKAVYNKLVEYVTRYKTGKQMETVRFLEARAEEASNAYKANQQRVAGFKDNNYGVIFQSVQSKEQQLQNEFNLSFTIYNQLATQLEQARIQLKKETPVFSVLEPIYVPTSAAEPSVPKTLLIYVVAGFILSLAVIAVKLVRGYFS